MPDPRWAKLIGVLCRGDFEDAEILLSEDEGIRELRSDIGETALHWLAVENQISAVKWLFNHGYDLDCRNTFGTPAVWEVAALGYRQLLKWMVESGASVVAADHVSDDVWEYLDQAPEMAEYLRGLLKK